MLVNRFIFITVTAIIMIALLAIQFHPLLAAAITIFLAMSGYIIISYIRSKKRLSLLEEECDPEAFLERTEEQRAITGRNSRYNTYFDIDRAAGLITLGRFEEAKEILLSVDGSRLSRKNDTLLVYTINLILCFYELGEVTRAEELFETQIPTLPPINTRIVLAVNVLVGERFFFLGRYDESCKHFNGLLSQKLSKRTRIGIIYYLAQVEEKMGNITAAWEKYRQVAQEGNKLWIAEKAREKCKG